MSYFSNFLSIQLVLNQAKVSFNCILKIDAAFNFRHWTVVRVWLFSDIGHVMTKIDWEERTKIKMCMYTFVRRTKG